MKVQFYENLTVWQKSMDLVVEVYNLTDKFPKSELYGLSSQMRRAAVSVPSNIAEGQRRNHKKEFVQFLSIAYGSGAELEMQIKICKRLKQLHVADYTQTEGLLDEIMKMLNSLIRKLK
jgi:four helix bundle protein